MPRKPFNYCPLCQSQLEMRSVESRNRLVCPRCHWIHYVNPLPCSAAFVQNSRGEILLVQRGVEPGKGKWGLPSGFMEIDETPEEACLRELWEETGLKGEIKTLIGVYSQESSLYKQVIIVGYEVEAKGKMFPGSDSLDVNFFSRQQLPEIAFSSHRQIIQDGANLREK